MDAQALRHQAVVLIVVGTVAALIELLVSSFRLGPLAVIGITASVMGLLLLLTAAAQESGYGRERVWAVLMALVGLTGLVTAVVMMLRGR